MVASTKKKSTTPMLRTPTSKLNNTSQDKKKSPKKSPKKKSSALTAETSFMDSAPVKKLKTTVKKTSPQFTREPIPVEKNSNSGTPEASVFTTLLALLVIAGVVLAGYVYAQKIRMEQLPPPAPLAPSVQSTPRRVNVSSSVTLTPEIVSSLESIIDQVTVPVDDVLENVRHITDVSVAQSESPEFFSSVQAGDMVFEFGTLKVLFRPSSKLVIKAQN